MTCKSYGGDSNSFLLYYTKIYMYIHTNLQESPAKALFASSASSFRFIGSTKGSRCARAAAIVNAGSRH